RAGYLRLPERLRGLSPGGLPLATVAVGGTVVGAAGVPRPTRLGRRQPTAVSAVARQGPARPGGGEEAGLARGARRVCEREPAGDAVEGPGCDPPVATAERVAGGHRGRGGSDGSSR